MPHTLDARAILFDMDGTLVNSHAVVDRIWTTFAERFGLDTATVLATCQGVRMIDTVRRYVPADTDAIALTAELSVIELADTDGIVEIPGARAFVAELPAASVALVTSATLDLAQSRMHAVDIPMPVAVVTAEDVDRGKPYPDCYLAAAATVGVAPDECVVFEDAEAGIAAGLAAGMRVVVVGTLAGDITAGLPRISDFYAITSSISGDRIVLTIRD